MTRARLFGGRPTPILRDKAPRRRGAGGIEALSSYISSQARDSSCAPYTLLSTVLIPAEEALKNRWRRVRSGESHLINGYTDIACSVAAAVDTCTHGDSAEEMTFRSLRRFCDPKGKHFLHLHRPWCSACYLEARAQGISPWDPLYSYVRTSRVCIWHRTPFLFLCAKCKRGQRHVPKFPFLDLCEHCGTDLAVQTPSPLDERSLEEQLWFSNAARDTISYMARGRELTADNFAKNVQAMVNMHFNGQEQPFAVRLGIAESGPRNWMRRGAAPTWSSVADLAHRLDIPPSQLGSAEAILTDPHYWRYRPAAALDQPHTRPDDALLNRARAELHKEPAIKEKGRAYTVESLKALAKRMEIGVALLMRHFPEEYKEAVDRRKRLRALLRMNGVQEKEERLRAAAAAVTAQGLPMTERNLKRTGLLRVSDLVQNHLP